MNSKLSITILIIVTTFGLEVISVQTTYANNNDYEREIIGQFYNYVDLATNIKLDNMLRMTQEFAERLHDSIPLGDRGNTAELLHQYRVNAQRLRDQGGQIDEKEKLLMELQQLIATIKSGLAKQEKEDIILRRGLLGMFELLARLSIEERKFNNKFSKAASLLRQRFSAAGIQLHQQLFDILEGFANANDIVEREQLFARFKELKAQEI